MKPKVKLLKGNSPDVISANVSSLKSAGYSHNHATHFALRHSNKKHTAKAKSIAKSVVKKTEGIQIKRGPHA